MKIYPNELARLASRKQYEVDIDEYLVEDNVFLKGMKDVIGAVCFYYDANDELRIVYDLRGEMICPDAITMEEIYVPFEINNDEKVVYSEDEEGFYLSGTVELDDLVYYIVSPEAPIKVVKNKKIEYSRGDGWIFVSEDDYESSKKDEIDPRLQKLKEFKLEEGD
ncbi:MAG: hypothetical protein IKX97_07720 [Erysipelotrichaceae bacterium]|nr:hypothetical protein [Erysipelotrichaceae bacterium]